MTWETLAAFGTIIAAIVAVATLLIFFVGKMLAAHSKKMDEAIGQHVSAVDESIKTHIEGLKINIGSINERLERLEQDFVKYDDESTAQRKELKQRLHALELDIAKNYIRKGDVISQQTGDILLQRLSVIIDKIEQKTQHKISTKGAE